MRGFHWFKWALLVGFMLYRAAAVHRQSARLAAGAGNLLSAEKVGIILKLARRRNYACAAFARFTR